MEGVSEGHKGHVANRYSKLADSARCGWLFQRCFDGTNVTALKHMMSQARSLNMHHLHINLFVAVSAVQLPA